MLYELWIAAATVGFFSQRSFKIQFPSFRYPYLLIAPFFIQIAAMLVYSRLTDSAFLFLLLVNMSYLLLILSLWMNRHIPGFTIFMVGAIANALVFWLNDGRMPVSPDALIATGWDELIPELQNQTGFDKHQLLNKGTNLPFLADIIPLNRIYGSNEVISIGDVIQSSGIAYLIWNMVTGKKFRVWGEATNNLPKGGDHE